MDIYRQFYLILGLFMAFFVPTMGQRGEPRREEFPIGNEITPKEGEFRGKGLNETSPKNEEECLKAVPDQCPDDRIFFTLYNRNLHKDGVNVSIPIDSWSQYFKPTDTVKIIIHGIIIEYMTPELYDIKDEYIKRPNCHVLFVHFEPYAPIRCSTEALDNIKIVGKCIAKMIMEFVYKLSIKDIHVITYSLGGHVANYVAGGLSPYKLPRITALDPPALFVSDENRLDPEDAQFIDVFYTSAISLAQNRGHASFFFNGGFYQPGCYLGFCSHSRAVQYFKESISSPVGFYASPCDSYFAYMFGLCQNEEVLAGDGCPSTANGLYFVTTNEQFPFARGKSSRKGRNLGNLELTVDLGII